MSARRVPAEDLKAYVREIMIANGVDEEQARSVSDIMIWNELVGRPNHGIKRLPVHLKRLSHGVLNCPCRPRFDALGGGAMERLDGDAGFGYHVGLVAMDRAIELASTHGVGVVCVHNSNYFGTGAFFVDRAAQAGMIGLALSNSFPKVTPCGGNKPVFGTNPLAFGAPRRDGHSVMLDMATSQVAGSLIRELIDEGGRVPVGVAIDASGDPITDPRMVSSGTLLPFGGHKGSGLALMVELLSGVITGAGVSHGVASMLNNFEDNANIGHFFMALEISRLMPLATYHDRVEDLIEGVKDSRFDREVLIPGERRWREYESNTAKGLPFGDQQGHMLGELADPFDIKPPW